MPLFILYYLYRRHQNLFTLSMCAFLNRMFFFKSSFKLGNSAWQILFNIKFFNFQYKIPNSILFLYKKRYTFGITNTALCCFCNTLKETPIHIFFYCVYVKCLWERLQMKFQNNFVLPSYTPQTAILGLYNKANENYNLQSHISLIYQEKNKH